MQPVSNHCYHWLLLPFSSSLALEYRPVASLWVLWLTFANNCRQHDRINQLYLLHPAMPNITLICFAFSLLSQTLLLCLPLDLTQLRWCHSHAGFKFIWVSSKMHSYLTLHFFAVCSDKKLKDNKNLKSTIHST